MMLDSLLQFDPANTAITVDADSTNILDVAGTGLPASPQGRDIGIGRSLLKVRVLVQVAFAAVGAATLKVQLKAAIDNGSGLPGAYFVLAQTDDIPKASLIAGAFIDIIVPPIPPQMMALPPYEGTPPRFYKLSYDVTTGPFTLGQVQAFLTDGLADNNVAYKAGFPAQA